MSIIVLDIETTGLPKTKKYNSYYRSSLTNYYDSSRIIQLGYQIFDQNGRLILEEDDLILNDYEITNSHIHGITPDEIKTKGITIKESFDKLYKNIKKNLATFATDPDTSQRAITFGRSTFFLFHKVLKSNPSCC